MAWLSCCGRSVPFVAGSPAPACQWRFCVRKDRDTVHLVARNAAPFCSVASRRSRKDTDSMEMGERKVSISEGDAGDSPSDDKRRRVYSEILSPRRLLELTQAMDSIELEQTLSKVPLFNTLRSEEVSKLAKGLQYIVVEDGEFVYRQGEEGQAFYIIMSGHIEKVVESTAESTKPDIVIGKPLEPGTYFGQMALVNANERRSCSMRAKGRTELQYIDREGFNKHVGNLTAILKRSASNYHIYESHILARQHST